MKLKFKALLLFLLSSAQIVPASENLGEFIIHHIINSDSWHPLPGVSIPLPAYFEIFGINMGITLHVFMILLAAVLMILVFKMASRRNDQAPAGRLGHAVEAMVIYLRDELVVPNLGKKDAPKWLPFFLTLFFFILFLNLIGMIPGMSTATANANFTAGMSILIFFVFNVSGMIRNGAIHYFTNLVPKGIPLPVLFILAPIEIAGLFIKVTALAIRLFANMSAGHIIILSLLGLISVLKGVWIVTVPASIAFSLFISLIEVLVAFLQAYVFTLLSSLFIGMALHQDH